MTEQRKGIIHISTEGLQAIMQLPDNIDIERCHLEHQPGKQQELMVIVTGPGLPEKCIIEGGDKLEPVHPRYRGERITVFDGLD